MSAQEDFTPERAMGLWRAMCKRADVRKDRVNSGRALAHYGTLGINMSIDRKPARREGVADDAYIIALEVLPSGPPESNVQINLTADQYHEAVSLWDAKDPVLLQGLSLDEIEQSLALPITPSIKPVP